jgi:hypothetical protein
VARQRQQILTPIRKGIVLFDIASDEAHEKLDVFGAVGAA